MRFPALLPPLLFAAGSALAGAAAGDYELAPTKPLDIVDTATPSDWSATNAATLYVGSACRASGDARPVSKDNNGDPVFLLRGATYGTAVSEHRPDFYLGDWCTMLPVEASRIDWARTGAGILASAACADGFVYYNASSTNDLQRILFTRGGAVTVDWYLRGETDPVTRTYDIGRTCAGRPYRVFWTENGFGGPTVKLGDRNNPRHVRLLGDRNIFGLRYDTPQVLSNDPYNATSNIVYGVEADDVTSYLLRVYATFDETGAGQHDGPRGQFVLAYYDTGSKDTLLYTIVVEVDEPDVSVVEAEVGDRLLPSGTGYDIEHLDSNIIAGLGSGETEHGDTAAPYLYRHTGLTDTSPKSGWVYAIAPTDASSQSATGVDAPHKADVWWVLYDPMGTKWPYEHDRYLIRWGADDPVVVAPAGDEAGAGVRIPENYVAEVCEYSDPKNVAAVSSNVVNIAQAGRFTLKLKGDDNIWFLPMRAVARNDANVFEPAPGEWHVGNEIVLRADAAAGRAADLAALADASLPGYIHEPASTGRNWNPFLYRAPGSEPDGAADGASGGSFDALDSAIYAVRASDKPIEVWWYRSWKDEDMAEPIVFPTIVQRYKAIWPLPEETHEIVLASQLGGAGTSYSASSQALYLAATNSTATAANLIPGSARTGATVGFWVNGAFRAAEYDPVGPGRILAFGGGALVVESLGATRLAVNGTEVAIPANDWTHIACEVDAKANRLSVFRDGRKVAEADFADAAVFATNECDLVVGAAPGADSATGVGLDALVVWPFLLAEEDFAAYVAGGATESTDRRRYSWLFEGANDLAHVAGQAFRTSADTASGRTLTSVNCLSVAPGGPGLSKGELPAEGGVAPRIYAQNDSAGVGYNPNEEHAFVREGADGYVVYALRCDLNAAGASEPFVLAEFADAGKGAMRAYHVCLTNAVYSTLESEIVAGNLMEGPHPLDFLDGFHNEKNYCRERSAEGDDAVVYRDRHKRMWARRDGTTEQFNYYPVQPGFCFPSLETQPEPGTLVGWMAFADATNAPTEATYASATPLPWTWHAVWPADDKIPAMRVGQTLSTADQGLPEVWNALSMAVVYPVPRSEPSNDRSGTVVTLIDPTVAQTAELAVENDFPGEYGFTVGHAGTCQLKGGKYRFTGLPPNISDRFYVDMNAAADKRMVLVGQMVSRKAGTSYLQINTLSAAERKALKDICTAKDGPKERWDAAVDALATDEVQPSTRQLVDDSVAVHAAGGGAATAKTRRIHVDYRAADHYALVANGCGTGYVTLVENDSDDTGVVPAGSTVSMHILKVVPELYAGSLVVLEDPLNKLSEQLNVLYTAPFGASSDNFEFEWRKREPPADGHVPDDYDAWTVKEKAAGRTGILLGAGGAGLPELVNTYYAMRYRALEGTPAYGVTSNAWSAWCGPTLAEGWVQRVLKNVTPFAQRLDDFYENATELAFTMPAQIGGPYHGDVALNNDNLEEVGLLELYQTVLNKAESLSLTLGIDDLNANKQLVEAASRLADLYTLLGDEAYSDAANPTIACSSTDGWVSDYELLPASTYCFANQVPSLLDEELALLRGRTKAVAPNMTTYPYYNRLMWNFTKGVTQGEMAYVQNYGIIPSGGEITPEQAAAQFPQGHGDAWGHYLSAVWGYYRLLRNPYFRWGDPGMMEMLVADSIVNMDYEDEQKLAMAAAKMAQAGAEVADLTARKTWRDQDGATGAGYFDANADQGFGYGEWAVRTGLGALWNWATVNSLLPTNETASFFADHSIADVTRDTVPALGLLAENFAAVDRRVNRLDAGLNPLGLSANAVPFDIDPAQVADGTASHFEQILERAERALDNAQTVLAHASRFGSRLAQIARAEGEAADAFEQFETAYRNDLIAIYGTPYPDDIGPGGTYPQGYDGPDIYHYQYMDLGPYGVSEITKGLDRTVTVYKFANETYTNVSNIATAGGETISVAYNVSPGGILVKPPAWTSVRATEGSIQAAYREFLAAYVAEEQAFALYGRKVKKLGDQWPVLRQLSLNATNQYNDANALYQQLAKYRETKLRDERAIMALECLKEESDFLLGMDSGDAAPWIVAGFACGSDVAKWVGKKVLSAINLVVQTSANIGITIAKGELLAAEDDVAEKEASQMLNAAQYAMYSTQAGVKESIASLLAEVYSAARDVQTAYGALAAAEAAYRAEVAKGDRLLAERETLRKQQSNGAVASRYADMFYRVQRNAALSKFRTAFDVAQRYVWQLAKVYDYETGLLSSDRQAGDAFLRETIATRALGVRDVSVVADGTDGGLWDVVTRMKGNWDVLKGRLGVNNPDASTKRFSLRYSLLRIKPGAEGDAAWRQALRGYWVDDILADTEFTRYCQPPQGSGPTVREPGLVIPFSTAVNLAENFFGKPLLGGETTFSSSDYAVKIHSVGVRFEGYDALATPTADGLAVEPNVYLVPVGRDYMRAPAGTTRETLAFRVVDQVLPLPYAVGSSELDDEGWVASFSGLDGTTDSAATIRRHSTLRAGEDIDNSRLVGRSVWNDRWLLVIPASSLSSDRARALETFIKGMDSDKDGRIDVPGVSDIVLGIKA